MELQAWTLIPFILMLLAIALLPALVGKWWESNLNKLLVSLLLAVPTCLIACYFDIREAVAHQVVFDYIPFIVLLLGLFAVTGGIHLSGDLLAKPTTNTAILGIGAVLASLIGTTGAAMLLIRPLLETNRERTKKVHTVLFFIAVVANCGGLLTPLGDPPLFMLYLYGAPFGWFFHLLPEWLLFNVTLLVVYFLWDSRLYRREPKEALARDAAERTPLRITGKVNFIWLVGIVLAVAFLNEHYFPFMAGEHNYWKFLRDGFIALMIFASLLTTSRQVRIDNKFSWAPILEVACLFIGIFITMVPALQYLQQHAPSLGLTGAKHFYFATGALSGFLDNTPTALAFHAVAKGLPVPEGATLVAGIPQDLLAAISLGAVMFGSLTYIGNGPNFMVKSIAEENGIKMPSFFRYMTHFSLIVLLPIFIVIALLFL